MILARLTQSWLCMWVSLCVAFQSTYGTDPNQDAATKLATSIRKAQLQKIAVVPIIFLKDSRSKQRNDEWDNDRSKPLIASSTASASVESMLLAEQLERYLSAASNGAFRLVPSIDLQQRISQRKGDLSSIHPRGKEFANLINPDGDLDGIIVGEVSRFFEMQPSGIDEIMEQGSERKTVQWSLIDLSNRTIVDTDLRANSEVSLAEVVYRGHSAEFFRYEEGKLRCLLDYRSSDRFTVPLSPRASELLYRRKPGMDDPVHPVINPNNPFQVSFEDDGELLPVNYVLDESGLGVRILETLIHRDPNDEFAIRVSNRSPQSVMVAVFVDGVNILGKRRELPDEKCHVWSLASNATALFDSWWTVDDAGNASQADATKEPFVISDWNDSVAGKMGLEKGADTSGSITVVFFSNGLPNRNNLVFYDNSFSQFAELSPDKTSFSVREGQVEFSGGSPRAFGVGAQSARRESVQMIPNARAGTILTSMTFRYCPRSEMMRVVDTRLSSKSSNNRIPKYTILELPNK